MQSSDGGRGDHQTGASFGERSSERITYRNGYQATP